MTQILNRPAQYINALPEGTTTYCALGIVMVHRCTGEEKYVDLLCSDDRIATVLSALRPHFNSYWTLGESWEIEPLSVVMEAA